MSTKEVSLDALKGEKFEVISTSLPQEQGDKLHEAFGG